MNPLAGLEHLPPSGEIGKLLRSHSCGFRDELEGRCILELAFRVSELESFLHRLQHGVNGLLFESGASAGAGDLRPEHLGGCFEDTVEAEAFDCAFHILVRDLTGDRREEGDELKGGEEDAEVLAVRSLVRAEVHRVHDRFLFVGWQLFVASLESVLPPQLRTYTIVCPISFWRPSSV